MTDSSTAMRDDGWSNQPVGGEYIGERSWACDGSQMLLAEIAFRRDGSRRSAWPWEEFLGGPELYNSALAERRELLRCYKRY